VADWISPENPANWIWISDKVAGKDGNDPSRLLFFNTNVSKFDGNVGSSPVNLLNAASKWRIFDGNVGIEPSKLHSLISNRIKDDGNAFIPPSKNSFFDNFKVCKSVNCSIDGNVVNKSFSDRSKNVNFDNNNKEEGIEPGKAQFFKSIDKTLPTESQSRLFVKSSQSLCFWMSFNGHPAFPWQPEACINSMKASCWSSLICLDSEILNKYMEIINEIKSSIYNCSTK